MCRYSGNINFDRGQGSASGVMGRIGWNWKGIRLRRLRFPARRSLLSEVIFRLRKNQVNEEK
jgi:hypothetical protein